MFFSAIKSFRKIITVVLLFLLPVMLVVGCSAQDPSAIAIEIAENWAAENIDKISNDLTDMVMNDNLILKAAAAATVEKKINKLIVWDYSLPVEMKVDLYKVVATAYSDVEIPVIGSYRISLSYNLTIDTGQKQILDAVADKQSFSFQKL